MQVVVLFDSPLKSGNMGASKQLSNDLKIKIVQHYGLEESYIKLSQIFKLSVIEKFGHYKGRYAWRQKITEFQEKHLLPTVKFGGGSIMLWGC